MLGYVWIMTFCWHVSILYNFMFMPGQVVKKLNDIIMSQPHSLHKIWSEPLLESLGTVYVNSIEGIIDTNRNVTKDHGEVTIFIPTLTQQRYDRHIDIIYWLHGRYGYNVHDFRNRMSSAVKALNLKCGIGRGYIVVVPELSWSLRNYGQHRQLHYDFNELHTAIVTLMHKIFGFEHDRKNDVLFMVGYSAGGKALSNILLNSCDHDDTLNRYFYYVDANFGNMLNKLWLNCLSKNKNIHIKVMTLPYGETYDNARQFIKKFPESLDVIQFEISNKKTTHIKMGDASYNGVYDDICN